MLGVDADEGQILLRKPPDSLIREDGFIGQQNHSGSVAYDMIIGENESVLMNDRAAAAYGCAILPWLKTATTPA